MKSPKLYYVYDDRPGYTRKKTAAGFSFFDPQGNKVKSKTVIDRLKRLAVPPAYENVWYCKNPRGHIQAVGFDARGRKQYRYHADWIKERDQQKYDRMIAFAKALPRIRKMAAKDLKREGLPKEKVLAGVVSLLEKTLIRVGNDEYAKKNQSFGLTTLKNHHVVVKGSHIRFKFKGKSHVVHDIEIDHPRLAKIIKQCQNLPGYEIFEYVDEKNKIHDVKSDDINQYIKQISGHDFTAKDFRTWAGTLLAAKALKAYKKFNTATEAKKQVLEAIESVSKKLGNTKAICRKCYVHPFVLDAHLDGTLGDLYESRAATLWKEKFKHLSYDEAIVLGLLEQNLKSRR